ncbi:nuclear transport factor 2 family protein [Salegentibacter sp. F14]
MSNLISPNFTLIGAGAKAGTSIIDKKLYLNNVANYNWPEREVEIIDVQSFENIAVVRCLWSGTEPPGFNAPKPDNGVYKFLLTDIWVYNNESWKVLARHSSFGY